MADALVDVESGSRLRRIPRTFLSLAILLGTLNIVALYAGNRPLVYLTKPATMLVILILAAAGRTAAPRSYGNLILGGLVCSLAGDIFLMLPSDQFVPGLVSFLIAHLFYIAAFRSGMSTAGPLWLALPFYAYGGVAFWILLPGVGEMKTAVLAYLLVILTMAWQSSARWNAIRDRSAGLAFAGALLFVASDSTIALNRFHGRFYLAEALIMITYFAAQWLMALSARRPGLGANLPIRNHPTAALEETQVSPVENSS